MHPESSLASENLAKISKKSLNFKKHSRFSKKKSRGGKKRSVRDLVCVGVGCVRVLVGVCQGFFVFVTTFCTCLLFLRVHVYFCLLRMLIYWFLRMIIVL